MGSQDSPSVQQTTVLLGTVTSDYMCAFARWKVVLEHLQSTSGCCANEARLDEVRAAHTRFIQLVP